MNKERYDQEVQFLRDRINTLKTLQRTCMREIESLERHIDVIREWQKYPQHDTITK